jgi:hypothetical protein
VLTPSTIVQCFECSPTFYMKAAFGKQGAKPKLSQRQREWTKSSTMAERWNYGNGILQTACL